MCTLKDLHELGAKLSFNVTLYLVYKYPSVVSLIFHTC